MSVKQLKTVTVHKNGQITLGKQFAGQTFKIDQLADGQLLLSRGKFVLDSQETFFTPAAASQLKDFNEWASDNPPSEEDAEQTIKNMLKD